MLGFAFSGSCLRRISDFTNYQSLRRKKERKEIRKSCGERGIVKTRRFLGKGEGNGLGSNGSLL